MECLKIEWKQPDVGFVKDEFYESIQAPKWLDFDSPEEPVDDHEWFCKRAGCTHEKKPFCQAPPVSPTPKPQPQGASTTLHTILAEMSKNQSSGRMSNPVASVVPPFVQRVAISCDDLAYSLFTTFFCCFP